MLTPTKTFRVFPADAALVFELGAVNDFLTVPFIYTQESDKLHYSFQSLWVMNLRLEDTYSEEELEVTNYGVHPAHVFFTSDRSEFDSLKSEFEDKFFVGEVAFSNWGSADPVISVGGRWDDVDWEEAILIDPEFEVLKVAIFTNLAESATETWLVVFQRLPTDEERERMRNGRFKFERAERAEERVELRKMYDLKQKRWKRGAFLRKLFRK